MKLIAHIPHFDVTSGNLKPNVVLYSGIYISKTMNVAQLHAFFNTNIADSPNKLEYIMFGAELKLADIMDAMRSYLHQFKWIIEMEKKNYPCPLVNEFSTAAIRCDNVDDCLLYSLRSHVIVEDTKLLQELNDYNIGDRIISTNTSHKKGIRIVNYASGSMIKEKIKNKVKKDSKE